MRHIACALILLLPLLPAACNRKVDLEALANKDKEQERAERRKGAREDDKNYAKLIAGKDEDGDKAMEARTYLKEGDAKNRLWKTSREQTLKWTEDLYEAGAPKVYAVYSPADKTIKINMCASLLVQMPKEPELRAKLLKAFNKIDKQLWGDDHEKIKDDGQKYLNLNMDP